MSKVDRAIEQAQAAVRKGYKENSMHYVQLVCPACRAHVVGFVNDQCRCGQVMNVEGSR